MTEETSEDKVARLLRRRPFEDALTAVQDMPSVDSVVNTSDLIDVVESFGWSLEDFDNEWLRVRQQYKRKRR